MISAVKLKNITRVQGKSIVKIMAANLCLIVSAQIMVPALPVPCTLQTAVLLIMAWFLTPAEAMGAVALYLWEAFSGLPVLSGWAGGPLAMMGATAGYLWAFVPVVALLAWGAKRCHLMQYAGFMLMAVLAILLSGTAYLAGFVGWQHAWQWGFAPFVLVECAKVAACMALLWPYRYR